MILAKHGPLRTLNRKIRHHLRHLRYRGNLEEVFTHIYSRNRWRSSESRSGKGSELRSTEMIRDALPRLLKEHDIRRFLDVPCGDFNWMKHLVDDLDVDYIGGDIVRPLIERNQRVWGRDRVAFKRIDLTCDPLPDADLMMVRDCLFHLSFADVLKFLQNFCRANIRLLLTTSHWPPTGKNQDIVSGGARLIYLCSPPFCFPPEPLGHVRDSCDERPDNNALLLFDRTQVAVARDAMSRRLGVAGVSGGDAVDPARTA